MPKLDEAAYLRLVRGETTGPGAVAARLALNLPAAGYRLGAGVRNLAFDLGWRSVHRAGVPVVAVGNLTLGGTGKTPMVEWIARRLRDRGVRAAILSRGYGQAAGLNDEGRVLEANLPDVPHLQGRDRVALARVAVGELESQALILDDGFQHRRLHRDLDIVLLDALDPFGGGRTFPRGLLREPAGSLRRAGVVVLSRSDMVDPADRKRIRVEAERKAGPLRWAEARHAPLGLLDAADTPYPLPSAPIRCVAFCGIGNPEGFRRTLASLGIVPAAFRAFPDHHPYTAADVADLALWAREAGAELALTTQKDSVKLRADALGAVPLRALRIGLEIVQGREMLEAAIDGIVPPP